MSKNPEDKKLVTKGAVKFLIVEFENQDKYLKIRTDIIMEVTKLLRAIDNLPAVDLKRDSWVLKKLKEILKKQSAFTAHIVYGSLLKQLKDLESQAPK